MRDQHKDYARKKWRRYQRRRLGICWYCNEFVTGNGTRCEKHRIKNIDYLNEMRRRKKKSGLCVAIGCGRKAVIGKTYCQKHLDYKKKYKALKVLEYKKNNLCTGCGLFLDPQIDSGCVKCVTCRSGMYGTYHYQKSAKM